MVWELEKRSPEAEAAQDEDAFGGLLDPDSLQASGGAAMPDAGKARV